MHSHRDLHPALGSVFTVGEARAVGETPGRLRATDLNSPHRGVRTRAEMPAWSAYAPLLRSGERFSHVTAARLWGAPLPPRFHDDVHTTVPLSMSRAKGAAVIGHQGTVSQPCIRQGVPVSPPEAMFLELSGMLPMSSLVAVGDHLVLDPRQLDPHDLRPHISIDALRAAAQAFHGRGARRARIAARLVRPGVESPMETRLRLQLTGGAIPDPTCGYELTSDAGRRIGWFDLAWPDFKVIAEYDGDQHRTSTDQYERDIRRFDDADAAGWKVVRVRQAGLREPIRTFVRVRTALTQHGWRETSPHPPRDVRR